MTGGGALAQMAGGKGGKSQSRGSSKKSHRGRGHNHRRGRRELGGRNADEWESGEKPESIIEASGNEGDDAEHNEGVH
jgi:hypothetical protein